MKKYIKPELDLCKVAIDDVILASVAEVGNFDKKTNAIELWPTIE